MDRVKSVCDRCIANSDSTASSVDESLDRDVGGAEIRWTKELGFEEQWGFGEGDYVWVNEGCEECPYELEHLVESN